MNLLTLSGVVHDKASSVQFLQQMGILHNPRICGNGHPMILQLRDNGDRWRCRQRACRTEVPLRKTRGYRAQGLHTETLSCSLIAGLVR